MNFSKYQIVYENLCELRRLDDEAREEALESIVEEMGCTYEEAVKILQQNIDESLEDAAADRAADKEYFGL